MNLELTRVLIFQNGATRQQFPKGTPCVLVDPQNIEDSAIRSDMMRSVKRRTKLEEDPAVVWLGGRFRVVPKSALERV